MQLHLKAVYCKDVPFYNVNNNFIELWLTVFMIKRYYL